MTYHRLLQRQITKFLPELDLNDPRFEKFIHAVSDSYTAYERDKEISKHAFRLSEVEFNQINGKLQQEVETKKLSIDHLKSAFNNIEEASIINSAGDDLLGIVNYVNNQINKRKSTEAELSWNIKRITTLLRSLHSGVLVESEERKIVFTNNTFCKMFSIPYAPKDLVGFDCVIAADQSKSMFVDPEHFIQRMDEILRKKKQVDGEILHLSDGRVFERDFIPVIVKDEYRGHLWHYTDITERKRAQDELAMSEAKNRLIMNSALDAIITVDTLGLITSWNPQAEKIFGWTEEEVLGHNVGQLIVPPGTELHEKMGNPGSAKSIIEPVLDKLVELHAINKAGKIFPVELSTTAIKLGNTRFFCSFVRDISERRKAENKLRTSEEKYRSIIANMNLGLLEVDNDEVIQFANQSFCNMSGYNLDELIGNKATELLVRGENHVRIEDKKALRQDGISDVYEVATKNKRGELKWWLISGAPRYSENGELIGSVGIHLDITTQKETEYELVLARESAIQTSQAKESFLANMSHEIRTPLNGIIGFIRQLGKEELSTTQKMYADSAQKASKHLLSIVNNVLDLSKIEAKELQLSNHDFSLQEVMSDVVKILENQAAENNLALSLNYDNTLPNALVGDAARIRQVLINLTGNSIKFTEKGRVTLEAKSLGANGSNHELIVTIRDTGIGMEEDFVKRIFAKFQQEDISSSRKFGGTGLGMAITKELIDLMGGRISISSKKGKGTEINISLSLPIGDESKLVKKSNDSDIKNLNHKTILLVEDSSMNRIVAIKALENYPLTIREANNGAQAIDMIKRERFDLILMDLQMPVMGGIEATTIIRNELRNEVPIVALTANAFKSEIDKCLAAGMNDYLTKPFEEKDLAEVISKNIGDTVIEKQTSPAVEKTKTSADTEEEEKLYSLLRLREISHDDTGFIKEMLELFLDGVPKSADEMMEALKVEDVTRIKSIAHKIKPSMDNMGIASAMSIIKEIELFSEKKQPFEEFQILVKSLVGIIRKVAEQIITTEQL